MAAAAHGIEIALGTLRLGECLKSAHCLQYVREFQGRVTDDMRRSAKSHDFAERARGFRLWLEAGVP